MQAGSSHLALRVMSKVSGVTASATRRCSPMNDEEEVEYNDEPADDEPADEGGLPPWLLIMICAPLFFFMVWCGYSMGN